MSLILEINPIGRRVVITCPNHSYFGFSGKIISIQKLVYIEGHYKDDESFKVAADMTQVSFYDSPEADVVTIMTLLPMVLTLFKEHDAVIIVSDCRWYGYHGTIVSDYPNWMFQSDNLHPVLVKMGAYSYRVVCHTEELVLTDSPDGYIFRIMSE